MSQVFNIFPLSFMTPICRNVILMCVDVFVLRVVGVGIGEKWRIDE